ncbi:mitochondrial potassium channel ATP-binding subunit isoform X2 [Hydra vulgaris]|uniref:Mitochondrial potassium channel ATP-binding subunit n=1 Tax=Hydra vulgaris TaxID=6087 RepID=A0ABM4BHK9_HYDVU
MNSVLVQRGSLTKIVSNFISKQGLQCNIFALRFNHSAGLKYFQTSKIRYGSLFFVYPALRGFLFKSANCEKLYVSHKKCRISPNLNSKLITSFTPTFRWKLLIELIKPDWILFMFSVFGAFAVALVNIQTPLLLGGLINSISEILKESPTSINIFNELYNPCKKLVINYILQSIFTATYLTLLSSFGERLASRMRICLFTKLMEQDMSFFDKHKTGEIMNRLTTDIQDFKSSFKQVVSQGLRSFTQILGCSITLYTISPKLTSLMVLLLPGIILIGTGMGSLLRQISNHAQEQVSRAMGVADEAIGNIRTVRSFAMEYKEIGWYSNEVRKSQQLNEMLGAGIGVFQGLSNLAINGIVLAVLYTGAILVNNQQLMPGDLMSYLIATQTVQKSLASMSVLFGQFVKGMSAGARVFEYMELKPTLKLLGGKIIPADKIKGNISIEHIRFSYPNRPEHLVFEDLNLNIEAGKMVALVGSSGSGKSTLASLIEYFYDVESGCITIDGINIADLDPSWLRGELIGYINQEPTLFATTVMENIRYGSPQATDKQVIEAAKIANADGFIRSFPQAYDTIIGERGATVSGGQKQRIAIARALLKNPKILILDEATSALDSESERLVQNALDKLIQGRTVIVIAHRLSTIQNADLIAAMANGEIREIGTHKELIQKNGLYAELVRNQDASERL